MKKKDNHYLLPTIARKDNLPTFRLNAPVVIRANVSKLFFRAVVGNRTSFMQKLTEKPLKGEDVLM